MFLFFCYFFFYGTSKRNLGTVDVDGIICDVYWKLGLQILITTMIIGNLRFKMSVKKCCLSRKFNNHWRQQ
jgi:hypothetical protein